MSECEHKEFVCSVAVNRMEDIGRFMADVKVSCKQCSEPFRFVGLQAGMDVDGVTVSPDGLTATLAVAPKDEVLTVLDADTPDGFTIRKPKRRQRN
jgi:hypothetical protein